MVKRIRTRFPVVIAAFIIGLISLMGGCSWTAETEGKEEKKMEQIRITKESSAIRK